MNKLKHHHDHDHDHNNNNNFALRLFEVDTIHRLPRAVKSQAGA